MKILLIFSTPSGGMETLNRIRARALTASGLQCHLLYTNGGGGLQNISGITVLVSQSFADITKLIHREKYDVIIVCSYVLLLEHIRMSGYRGRIIFEVQGLGTPEMARIFLHDFGSTLRSCADGFLYPVTKHLEQLMQSTFPEMPHFCFDDPLDTESFGYSRFPIVPQQILGWIGRIEKNKNWREFLAIAEWLGPAFPKMELWMFVDADLCEPQEQLDFEHWMQTSPLAGRLTVRSNVPHSQMADYLSIIGDSGGLLLSTSIREGFGYAVAEAMLCRCPVLSTNSGGVKRFIIPDKTGKFYPRGNIEEAAKGAYQLMQDVVYREQIRIRGEQHIRDHFSTAVYVGHFHSMLQGIMQIVPKSV
ncbi:glycosyltransferase family 4 protein [Paenibacillus herberti]|uniref:Glycosyltransferase n=1 Tax=Paenibacillus herberti TaxID=1619309 RepID=A0A229NW65_9BACL|nr:glycosyltransferase family 4 protein [Paenibacillus herberti]OXM13889.1 glycosyltransferase [Paenibacillus herberti]